MLSEAPSPLRHGHYYNSLLPLVLSCPLFYVQRSKGMILIQVRSYDSLAQASPRACHFSKIKSKSLRCRCLQSLVWSAWSIPYSLYLFVRIVCCSTLTPHLRPHWPPHCFSNVPGTPHLRASALAVASAWKALLKDPHGSLTFFEFLFKYHLTTLCRILILSCYLCPSLPICLILFYFSTPHLPSHKILQDLPIYFSYLSLPSRL